MARSTRPCARTRQERRLRAAEGAGEDLRRPALRRDPAPRPQARDRGRAGRCSTSPTRVRCRSSPPTRSISPRPTTTRRTTPCCASPRAPTSSRTIAAGCRASISSRPPSRWRSCSPTCRRRWPTPIEIAKRCAFRPTGPQADPAALRRRRRRTTSEEEQLAARDGGTARPGRGRPEAAPRRHAAWRPASPRTTTDKRLDFEIGVISKMKFPGYFLIVADFIKWAKANGIPVGPGRGSGAGLRGRLVAHHHRSRSAALRPAVRALPQPRAHVDAGLRHRFLPGPARRGDPLRAEASTAPTAWRRSSRTASCRPAPCCATSAACCRCPTARSTSSASWSPTTRPIPVTLAQAIEGEPKLQEARDSEPVVARLLEIAQKLEGLYRHASTHAAGMVIGDRPLDELVPLYRDPKSSFPITQFNWKLVEAAGLVKFDFLGLKTLTVLQKAVALIKRGRGIDIDLAKLPLDDRKTLRAAGQGRHGRRVPARRHGHAREPQAAEARPLRGHHRHGGALPPRPHGQHPHLHQPQARGGAGRLPASRCWSRS